MSNAMKLVQDVRTLQVLKLSLRAQGHMQSILGIRSLLSALESAISLTTQSLEHCVGLGTKDRGY